MGPRQVAHSSLLIKNEIAPAGKKPMGCPSFRRCKESLTPLTFARFAPRLCESGTTDINESSIAPILDKIPLTITLKSGLLFVNISISIIPSSDPIG